MARAVRADPSRRDWASAFLAGIGAAQPEHLGRLLRRGHPGPVQPEHLAEVAVEHRPCTTSGWESPAASIRWSTSRALAVSPASMASVRSQGASDPASPRNGSRSVGRHRGPGAVGGGQGVEQALEPAHVAAQVLGQQGGGRRRRAGPVRPTGARSATATGPCPVPTEVSTTSPAAPTALVRAWGTVPPAPTSTSAVVASGSSQVGGQPLGVGGGELPGVAHHHHPPLDQEGRGGAGVDDRPHVELVDPGAAELLDHQRRVPAAHQLLAAGRGRPGPPGRGRPP